MMTEALTVKVTRLREGRFRSLPPPPEARRARRGLTSQHPPRAAAPRALVTQAVNHLGTTTNTPVSSLCFAQRPYPLM